MDQPCKNHENEASVAACAGCSQAFCENCLVEVRGEKFCASCKMSAVSDAPPPVEESHMLPCKEAGEALKYALVGILCFGFILEPVAIYRALQAKKKIKTNPNLSGAGKATAALVIGITVLCGYILWVIDRVSGNF